MRIWGRFRKQGSPYVQVRIICRRLRIDNTVNFLVDLGASVTLISPRDAQRLGIRYNQLESIKGGVSGVGGRAKTCLMPETKLIFRAEKGNFEANFHHLLVLQPASRILSKAEKLIPSLLGRDFLNQIALLVDKRKKLVLITDEDFTIWLCINGYGQTHQQKNSHPR